jgi:predicted NBD/HSP70 family sugar kinase
MGIAAHRFGSAQHSPSFLYVFLGEGIGSSLLLEGRPYQGSKGLAGEVGHITVAEDGEWCSCGNRGCLEVMASTTAVLRRTRERLSELPMDSVLRGRYERNELTLSAILEAARAGDKIAFQILDENGAFLGRVIAVALNLLGPELVVLGGPLTRDDGIILRALQRQVRLHALRQISNQTQIVYDVHDEFAGAHGMAALALDAVFDSEEHLQRLLERAKSHVPVESQERCA